VAFPIADAGPSVTNRPIQLDPDRVDGILAAARGRPVLVLGDVMLDRYLWGNVTRISPEAPVPVVDVDRETMRLGGAANVCRNVKSLGALPRLLAVVGEDETGERLRSELAQAGLPADGLIQDAGRRTTLKTRVVARGQHLVRADEEDRGEISEAIVGAMQAAIPDALEGAGAVIISDYGKGVVTRSLLEYLLSAAQARNVPVAVDPKDTHFFSYHGVNVITPNQHEAAEVLGYKLRTDEAVSRAGAEILSRLRARSVLITRGEKGMSLFEASGRRTDFPVTARSVYDVTGAGDTVVSAFTVAHVGGAVPEEAALLATHAAGLVVAELGTAVPDLEALRQSFRTRGA
jgi:D-glycero-beta-D-manno-heptose-7-phosphate kinase